jgi:hypothetical protein
MILTYNHQFRSEDDASAIANLMRKGWVEIDPPANPDPEPPPPPIVVSMLSLQLALVRANLYQVVTALINGIPDATQKLETQIYWAKSPTVDRQHPVVLGLVAALAANGVTETQVDAVFSAAQELDNPA